MIRLNERFSINADDRQLVLMEHVIRKKDDSDETYEGTNTLGYFTALPQVFAALYRRLQREAIQSTDMTLPEALNKFQELEQSVQSFARSAFD